MISKIRILFLRVHVHLIHQNKPHPWTDTFGVISQLDFRHASVLGNLVDEPTCVVFIPSLGP